MLHKWELTLKIRSDRLDKKLKSLRVKMISGWAALMWRRYNPRKPFSEGVREIFIQKHEMPSIRPLLCLYPSPSLFSLSVNLQLIQLF